MWAPPPPPQPRAEPSAVTKQPPTPGGLNINEPVGCWAREPGLTRSQQASAGPLITSCATAGRVPRSQAPGRGEGPALPGCISLRIAASLVTVSEQRAILTRAGSALLALEPRPTFSLSGVPCFRSRGAGGLCGEGLVLAAVAAV